jgi:uroporphyrinogen decarboxylase
MNGKERVKATIQGKPVDRIPLGFYVVDCDTIEKVIGRPTYVRNKVAQQIALWEGRRDEVAESCKADAVEFFKKIDCVDLLTFKEAQPLPPKGYKPENPPHKTGDNTWEDSNGKIYQTSELANEIVCVNDPVKHDVDDFTLESFPMPDISAIQQEDPSMWEAPEHLIAELGDDRYIAGFSGGIVGLSMPGGMETGLMLYAMSPEVIHATNRAQVAVANVKDGHHMRAGQDGTLLEMDTAGTNGPLVSPKQFGELCHPYATERVQRLRNLGQDVILHNCGDNRLLMDFFIEEGVQVYQSLQTNAGMDVEHLQDNWGDNMIFWGGIAVENLIDGTPEDMRKNVREAVEKGKRGRGFILGPSHSIAYGTKYDNFMAMLDEFDKIAWF